MVWISVPSSPFPSVCVWETGLRMCGSDRAVFWKVEGVWRQLSDRENVLCPPDTWGLQPYNTNLSSLASRKGWGRQMYTSPGSVSFLCGFLKIFIWFVFLYLQCTFVTSDLCIVLCMRREKEKKKKYDRCCPVKSFNLDFIFVPKWCLFCFL